MSENTKESGKDNESKNYNKNAALVFFAVLIVVEVAAFLGRHQVHAENNMVGLAIIFVCFALWTGAMWCAWEVPSWSGRRMLIAVGAFITSLPIALFFLLFFYPPPH